MFHGKMASLALVFDIVTEQGLPLNIQNNQSSTTISFKTLVKLRSVNGAQTLFRISSKNGAFSLTLKHEDTIKIDIDGTLVDAGSIIHSNNWSHVAFTADSSTKEMYLFVNGQQVYTNTAFTSSRGNILELKDILSVDGDLQLSSLSLTTRLVTAADVSKEVNSCQVSFVDAIYTVDNFANSPNAQLVIPSKCDAIDECQSSPCGNFECLNKKGNFECVCTGNYTGRHCDIPPDFCAKHGCLNGATCITGSSNYTCTCPYGYRGELCETAAVDGAWSEWTPWTICSVTCGGGQSTRTRTCSSPAPDPQGKDCQGNKSESQSCNTAECPKCTNLRRSFGVVTSCNETADATRCTIRCRDGLFFATTPLAYYECGKITGYTWNHVTKENPHGLLPSCSTVKPPSHMSINLEGKYDNVPCTSSNVNDAVKQIESKFTSLDCMVKQTCQASVVASGCDGMAGRKKRSAGDPLKLTVQLEATVDGAVTGMTMEQLMANYSGNNDNLKQLVQQILELEKSAQQIAKNSRTFFQMTIGGQQHTLSTGSLTVTPDANCPQGTVRLEAFCADSPAGSYSDGIKLTMCPKGQYQDKTGQTSCKQCPGPTTTVGIGSTGVSECSEIKAASQPSRHGKKDADEDTSHTIGVTVGVVVSIGFFVLCGVVGTLTWKHLTKRKRRVKDNYINLLGLRSPRAELDPSVCTKTPL